MGSEAAIAISNLGTEKGGNGGLVTLYDPPPLPRLKAPLALFRALPTNCYRDRSSERHLRMVFNILVHIGEILSMHRSIVINSASNGKTKMLEA